MREHVDRVKAMGRHLTGRGGKADAAAPSPASRRPGRLTSVTVLLVVLAVGVSAVVALAGHRNSLLGSSRASAAVPAAPLSPTRLLAPPPSRIANGTKALVVTLSAPVAAGSPPPTLRPAVAGSWTASGNSLVFTPVSTLLPCSTYALTVWANTLATGHSRLAHRKTIPLPADRRSAAGACAARLPGRRLSPSLHRRAACRLRDAQGSGHSCLPSSPRPARPRPLFSPPDRHG